MASQLQLRRGTTAQHAVFTGAPGEVTVDTDKKTVVVHDGVTQGGFPVSGTNLVNVKDYGAKGDGITSDSAAIEAAFLACPNGGCVYFPPTEKGYRITHTVRLWQASNVVNRKKNITFLGDNTRIFRDNPWYPITASAATDVISCPGHKLTNGQAISFCNLFNYNGLDRVIVSGAGTTAVNGTYNPVGWYQTRISYSNGTYTLRWNNQLVRWEIVQGSTVLYRTSVDKRVPWNATGWVADTGAVPAPSSFTRQRDIVDYGPDPEMSTPYTFLTGNIYYVRDVVADQSFKISATQGGPALDITIDITGGQLAFPITSNGTIFTAVGCGYTENQAIRLIGTGNPNIDPNRILYAVSVSGNTFGYGFTQFWSPPVNHGSPVTQGMVVSVPFPLFEVRNTEGYQFEGLQFDGGTEYQPLPLGTNSQTELLSYNGLLQFVNDQGYLQDQLCDNITIRKCTFTNSRNHGILYGLGPANLAVVASAGTAGVNGEYFSASPFVQINGRRFYTKDNLTIEWRTTSGGYWAILSGSTELYKSNNASTDPWTATGWTAVTGVGTPTVTLRVDPFRYRGDNFTVQECLFRNLDAAITGNLNAPRRLSFNDNHILDGVGRQYLDPALWAEGLRPLPEWFTWGAGGSAIVLMADIRQNIDPETRNDPFSHTSSQWTISGNIISNWGQQGGEISGARGLAVTGNVIEKTGYGLSFVGTGKGLVVTGNSFRSNTAYDLEWGSYGGVVTGNYFDGRAWNYTNTDSSSADERSLCGDGIIIYGPEVLSSSPAGYPTPAGVDNVGTTITGNTFTGHRTYSIRGWIGASNTVISGNIFHRRSNGNGMIVFWNPADNIVIDGNSFIHRNKGADPSINPTVSAAISLNGGKFLYTLSGIVGNGTTAVATTTSNHDFLVGDVVTVAFANQSQFNGTFTITAKTSNTFTYTMTSSFTGNATTSSTLKCALAKYMTIDRVRVTNNVFEGDPYGNGYVLLLNDQSLSPTNWVNINDVEISGNASPLDATPRGVWVSNASPTNGKYTNIRIRNNSGRIESSSLLSMRFDQTDARENNIPNAAPTFTPTRVGDLYFNNSTQVMYISTGTSSSADWQALSFWQP